MDFDAVKVRHQDVSSKLEDLLSSHNQERGIEVGQQKQSLLHALRQLQIVVQGPEGYLYEKRAQVRSSISKTAYEA